MMIPNRPTITFRCDRCKCECDTNVEVKGIANEMFARNMLRRKGWLIRLATICERCLLRVV